MDLTQIDLTPYTHMYPMAIHTCAHHVYSSGSSCHYIYLMQPQQQHGMLTHISPYMRWVTIDLPISPTSPRTTMMATCMHACMHMN